MTIDLALPAAPCAQSGEARRARPAEGDHFVFAAESRRGVGVVVALGDLVPNGPPVMTYPMEPRSKVIRDDSRLNQVVLMRFPPGDLAAETRARAAEGVVAYSGVCTHTGCDQWDWQQETRLLKCPCHFSEFDPRNAARVLNGPATRRLPALPLKVVDGLVVAAGGFVGRPGFETG